MEITTKKIIVVVSVIVVLVLGLTLGLVLGLRKKAKDDGDEVVIVNSYDNTAELIQKFPVNNPNDSYAWYRRKNPKSFINWIRKLE